MVGAVGGVAGAGDDAGADVKPEEEQQGVRQEEFKDNLERELEPPVLESWLAAPRLDQQSQQQQQQQVSLLDISTGCALR